MKLELYYLFGCQFLRLKHYNWLCDVKELGFNSGHLRGRWCTGLGRATPTCLGLPGNTRRLVIARRQRPLLRRIVIEPAAQTTQLRSLSHIYSRSTPEVLDVSRAPASLRVHIRGIGLRCARQRVLFRTCDKRLDCDDTVSVLTGVVDSDSAFNV